jgi:hypothetical protein
MKITKSILTCSVLCLATLFGVQSSSLAQPCTFNIPAYPGNTGNVTVEAYWSITGSVSSSGNLALLQDAVNTGNSAVSPGTYLGWCIDVVDGIDDESASETYSVLMYSTCQASTTLDSELAALGYPPTDVTASQTEWNAINYIINNKAGTYWDIQCALWYFIGGPESSLGAGYPPFPTGQDLIYYNQMVNGAIANPNYTPQCGNVIAVVLAAPPGGGNPTALTQLTIIEVPYVPTLTGGSLGCFKSVAAAESAALASVTTQLGSAPSSVTYSVASGNCPASITVSGSACGASFSVTYTATILTTPPAFVGTLPPKTATYTAYSQVPAAPTLTATDSCGDTAVVNYTTTQTNPNSSCDDVITRTWIASDCAGQTTTYTETITVDNTATQTTSGSCGFQGCKSGYVWCNAHLTCNPGKACTVYCQNATVTLTCKNGKTYSYPVPDCQVNFSQSCRSGNSGYQGNCWQTTVPSGGDSQIFLSGCGIPWQSDFANCTSISWKGDFCCSTPGVKCQWQCGASCYNCNLGNCNQIQVKPCYQNNCGWNNSDCAGTPENCKSYCQGGQSSGWGSWGGNSFCGNWSNNGSFSCR